MNAKHRITKLGPTATYEIVPIYLALSYLSRIWLSWC